MCEYVLKQARGEGPKPFALSSAVPAVPGPRRSPQPPLANEGNLAVSNAKNRREILGRDIFGHEGPRGGAGLDGVCELEAELASDCSPSFIGEAGTNRE